MSEIKNIPQYSSLSETQKRKFQEGFHADDLNYFASFSIEAGGISDSDVARIHSKIDARTSKGSFLNNFYILLCGIFIGVTAFFFTLEKNRTHQAHYEAINEVSVDQTQAPPSITESDSSSTLKSTYHKEHFSAQNSAEQITDNTEVYEDLETKTVTEINLPKIKNTEEANFIYIPNAPVIYLKDLKVANYRVYYFKNNEFLIMNGEGLAARFGDQSEAREPNSNQSEEIKYYAHQILKNALLAFNKKDYAACIELMEFLYKYNKNDVNAQFYIGMSYYYVSENIRAIQYLDEVLTNDINVFQQEAEFYKAVCLKNNGETKEATVLLNIISSKKLFYAKRSEELINEIK